MLTNYARNKLIDAVFRDQAITFPASFWLALYTVAPTAAGGGTEVSHVDVDRIEIPCSLTAWSGTQAAGSTGISSGTTGVISNNDPVTVVASLTAPLTGIVAVGLFDAATAGNLWHFGSIVDSTDAPITRSFSTGAAVEFAAGELIASWT